MLRRGTKVGPGSAGRLKAGARSVRVGARRTRVVYREYPKAIPSDRLARLKHGLGKLFAQVHPLHLSLVKLELRELSQRRDLPYENALELAQRICRPYEELSVNARIYRLLAILGIRQRTAHYDKVLLDDTQIHKMDFKSALERAKLLLRLK